MTTALIATEQTQPRQGAPIATVALYFAGRSIRLHADPKCPVLASTIALPGSGYQSPLKRRDVSSESIDYSRLCSCAKHLRA